LIVIGFVLGVSIGAGASDPLQDLRDQYQGKTFFLRGFYTGAKLRYGATGALVDGATPGDWTTDGVVLLTEMRMSGDRLIIKARRRIVSASKGTFVFLAEDPKKEKKGPPLKIEAVLDSRNPSPEQSAATMSRIFLTAQDNLAELVPDYWKHCLRAGVVGKDSNCHFASELLVIPGVAWSEKRTSTATEEATKEPSNAGEYRVGSGVSPPRVISQHEPEFSEPARRAQYQGIVTLMLVVNREGLPTKIHIVSPLGCGLDKKAVQAIETWRFKPAEKDGQPVAAEIAVEVDFHLY